MNRPSSLWKFSENSSVPYGDGNGHGDQGSLVRGTIAIETDRDVVSDGVWRSRSLVMVVLLVLLLLMAMMMSVMAMVIREVWCEAQRRLRVTA